MRVLPQNRAGINLYLGILLVNQGQQFRGGQTQGSLGQVLRNNVRRALVAVKQALQVGLNGAHLLMVHGQLAQQIGALNLRLEYVLLHPLANLVSRRCVLDHLVEHSLVLDEQGKSLLEVGKLKVVQLHRLHHVGANGIKLCFFRIGVPFCNLRPQSQFSRIGKLLRSADADIGEVAVRVACERLGAANAELLIGKGRIGQRRLLGGDHLRRARAMIGCGNAAVIGLRFPDQLRQWRCFLRPYRQRKGKGERGCAPCGSIHRNSPFSKSVGRIAQTWKFAYRTRRAI